MQRFHFMLARPLLVCQTSDLHPPGNHSTHLITWLLFMSLPHVTSGYTAIPLLTFLHDGSRGVAQAGFVTSQPYRKATGPSWPYRRLSRSTKKCSTASRCHREALLQHTSCRCSTKCSRSNCADDHDDSDWASSELCYTL